MEISDEKNLPWTPVDEENWQNFLRTQTGSRLIPKLLEEAAVPLRKGDTNEILIRNGELAGWQDCVNRLLILSHAQPRSSTPDPVSTEYPDLRDDSKWQDGQTLNSP